MQHQGLSKRVWTNPIYFIAFGFGSGLLPKAPGTFGTLAAIPIYLLLAQFSWGIYFLLTVVLFGLGVWVSDKVSHDLGEADYSGIVVDEMVGYLLTMFAVPFGLTSMVLGFILFRAFDIWKPWPIRYIDTQVSGGMGVMLDDVLAALMAWVILQILAWGIL